MLAASNADTLLSSPPAESGAESLHRWLVDSLAACDVLALNLHGFEGVTTWHGQINDSVEPVAFGARDIMATDSAWNDKIVFCEVCFSARNREIPQAMYRCGARAVIGSIGEAYGRTRATLPLPGFDGEADRLLSFFLFWYRRLRDPSRALRAAKKTLAVWSWPLDREDRATLESFVIIPKEV